MYIQYIIVLLLFTRFIVAEPRRLPKIYNAVITSSENLEPSRAYPIVQPVLRPAAVAYQVQVPYLPSASDLPTYLPFTRSLANLGTDVDAAQPEYSYPVNNGKGIAVHVQSNIQPDHPNTGLTHISASDKKQHNVQFKQSVVQMQTLHAQLTSERSPITSSTYHQPVNNDHRNEARQDINKEPSAFIIPFQNITEQQTISLQKYALNDKATLNTRQNSEINQNSTQKNTTNAELKQNDLLQSTFNLQQQPTHIRETNSLPLQQIITHQDIPRPGQLPLVEDTIRLHQNIPVDNTEELQQDIEQQRLSSLQKTRGLNHGESMHMPKNIIVKQIDHLQQYRIDPNVINNAQFQVTAHQPLHLKQIPLNTVQQNTSRLTQYSRNLDSNYNIRFHQIHAYPTENLEIHPNNIKYVQGPIHTPIFAKVAEQLEQAMLLNIDSPQAQQRNKKQKNSVNIFRTSKIQNTINTEPKNSAPLYVNSFQNLPVPLHEHNSVNVNIKQIQPGTAASQRNDATSFVRNLTIVQLNHTTAPMDLNINKQYLINNDQERNPRTICFSFLTTVAGSSTKCPTTQKYNDVRNANEWYPINMRPPGQIRNEQQDTIYPTHKEYIFQQYRIQFPIYNQENRDQLQHQKNYVHIHQK